MKETTLVYVMDASRRKILLAQKLRGIGAGYLNGAGGHIENGETSPQAAVRELSEEFGLVADEGDLVRIAEQDFHLGGLSQWRNTTYLVHRWSGEPRASADGEMGQPQWYVIDSLPYEGMWPDDILWLPAALAGNFVQAEFWFAPDSLTLLRHTIHELRPLSTAESGSSPVQ